MTADEIKQKENPKEPRQKKRAKKAKPCIGYSKEILTIADYPYLAVLYGSNYETIGGSVESASEKAIIEKFLADEKARKAKKKERA